MFAKKNGVGIMLALGLIFSAVRTVLVSFNIEVNNVYEDETYYLPESFAFKAFGIATVLAVAIALYLAFLAGRKKKVDFDHKHFAVSAASCILAFVLLGEAVFFFVSHYMSKAIPERLELLMIIFAVLSGVSFLVNGVRVGNSELLAKCTLLPLVFSILRLIEEFIRASTTPLASSGAYHIVGLCAVLLYFLCEGKAFAGIGSGAFYYFYGYASILLLLIYSVPKIILPCFGPFEFNYYTFLSVVDIFMVIYIASRLSSTSLIDAEETKELSQPESETAIDNAEL